MRRISVDIISYRPRARKSLARLILRHISGHDGDIEVARIVRQKICDREAGDSGTNDRKVYGRGWRGHNKTCTD